MSGRLQLEFVKQPVQVLAVEDQRRSLSDGDQQGPPVGVEGAALDADVGHRVLVAQAAWFAPCLAVPRGRFAGAACNRQRDRDVGRA